MSEPKDIGNTDDGKKIILKKGRFGPYLQVGNDEKEMKNFSIPKGISQMILILIKLNSYQDCLKFLVSTQKIMKI